MKYLKLHKRKIIAWLLFLSWLSVIFLFSSQNGEKSSNVSNGLIKCIEKFLNTSLKIDNITFLIRKAAHFTEYFILGLLTLNLISNYEKNIYRQITYTILFCICYATSDEIHQLFVSERAGQLVDVVIDSIGSIIANLLYFIAKKYHYKNI